MSHESEPGGDVDGQERAVVDRVVDGKHAVLLIGEEETEQVVPTEHLPDEAAEGTWLLIRRDDEGRVVEVVVDAQTRDMEQRIAFKLDQLRRRGRRLPGA